MALCALAKTVVDPVSKKSARVQRIATMDGDRDEAHQGHAIAIQLDKDLDIARGAVLAHNDRLPIVARSLKAKIVWLNETAFEANGSYFLRTATDLVPISNMEIRALLDLETLEGQTGQHL